MVTKFDDIQGRHSSGNMTDDEYAEMLKNELPDPAANVPRCIVDDSYRLTFGMSNNPYLRLLKKDRYICY
jgi:hypothetical protein